MHLATGLLALILSGRTASPPRAANRTRLASATGLRSDGAPRMLPAYLASVLGGAVLAVAWLVPANSLG